MAKAGQRAIDQRRVFGSQAVIVQTIFGESVCFEILHHDVGAARQPLDQRCTLGLRKIYGDGFLVAIGRQEIGRVALRSVGGGQERRAEVAGLVAFAGLFDLDDLGAEIAKDLRRPWRRQHAAEIEHAQV